MTQNFEYVLDMLEVHKELQESVIRDIVRRIVKNAGKITDTAAWQAECAQESGILLNDIIKWSARASNTLKKEIKQAFDDAETKIFDYDDTTIEAAGFDPVEFKSISPEMADVWSATLSKTSTEAVNLTKTIAVTSQTKYIQACDLASMQVSSGAFSYDTAIRNAIKSAAAQGVSVIYPSGWVDNLDVAIRRSVLTGVNQTAGQLQMMRAGELDNDIMEITAHAGARLEHAWWQGKLVSLSGKKGYLTLRDIGYGDVRGFMGANCRHNWHIFFVGISTPAYTPAQLENFKNETVSYNGKDMPLWKANDYQRGLERGIKEKKRQLVAIDEALKNTNDELLKSGLKMDFESLAVKLKSQEAKLKDFCKQTGVPRQASREQVFSVKTEKAIKNWGKSVSQKAVVSSQQHYDVWRKSIGAENTPKTLAKYYDMKYNDKKTYNLLQGYIKAINSKEQDISPLVGFEFYQSVANEVEKELIGIKTGDGRITKDYATHLIDRIIGQTSTPHEKMRQGTPIEYVKQALVSPVDVSPPYEKDYKGKPDIRINYMGKRCDVTYSITYDKIIQTNKTKIREG